MLFVRWIVCPNGSGCLGRDGDCLSEETVLRRIRETAFICEIPKCHCDNMASKYFQRIAAPGDRSATIIRCAATASEHSVWWLVAPL